MSNGEIVISKSTLVSIGIVFAALLIAIPALPDLATWGLVREWGQPLRRAFPPAGPGTPRLEAAILRGVVPRRGQPSR